MDSLLIVAGVVLIIGFVVLSFYLKAKRRKEFQAFAAAYGLQFSDSDPFDHIHWPFPLFSRGEGRGIENVVWGDWQGEPVTAFDYWYYTTSTDSKGRRHRTYYRFCCAVVEVNAAFPVLEIAPEGVLSRLADYVGLDDIDFELEAFNRRYNVKAKDRKFAYEIVDARMIRWLMSLEQPLGFEVVGSRILAHHRRLPPRALVPVIGSAHGFRQHVPRVAWGLYPPDQGYTARTDPRE